MGGMGAKSSSICCSLDDLPAVERYIRNQKHHHTLGAIELGLEIDGP